MRSTRPIFVVLLLAGLLLSACNLPSSKNTSPTDPASAALTSAAGTVSALITEQARLTQAVGTPLPPLPTSQATVQVVPSNTPVVILPSSTSVPPSPTVKPEACNHAEFVTDVTVPDDTTFTPGKTFTKTWRLINKGTCTWTTSYKLVFDTGNAMQSPATLALPTTVKPDETVDISVNLVAPQATGSYQGNWKLQDASGSKFGLGPGGTGSLWVKIVVANASGPFAVTHIGMTSAPASYTGVCPVSITFNGAMEVSAPGTVTYFWEFSDGTQGTKQSLEFTTAGTKTVSTTWNVGSPGQTVNGYAKIYIDIPNHQYFSNAAFSVVCNP